MIPPGVSGAHTEPGLLDDAVSGETLAGFSVAVPPVAPSEPTLAVQEAFSANPDLYAIAVVDNEGHPLGIVNRFRFLETLSRPFGRDLFLHQTIAQAMDASPLIVDEHTSIETLSGILTDDKSKYIFDGFIVTRDGKYIGIGTGYSLMRLITERRQTALERLAYYDALTGLPNRRLFQDRLQQAIASASRNGRCSIWIWIASRP
jgi:CBS domain-containing protein